MKWSVSNLLRCCGLPFLLSKKKSLTPHFSEDGEMRQERRSRGDPSAEGGDSGPPRERSAQDSRLGVACVELTKKEGCNLGLVITGGIDKDLKPRVSYLKPGGIAHRSDVLQEGDYIASVNGVRTALLRHEEIVSLLRGAGEYIMLEIEYDLPEPPQNTFSVLCKRIDVQLERDSGSYGFTLRGGMQSDPGRCRPLTVTQIRPGGAADREGTLKVGDRILSISGVSSAQCSLMDALALLRGSEAKVILGVEYDVSVMDAVERAAGPLLVEIDKASGSPLGLSVGSTVLRGKPVICIENIQSASIADRCGALHIGDHILAIDDTSFEHVSVAEAMQILKRTTGSHVKLEIVPIRHIKAQSQSALVGHTEVEIHERVRSLKENGTANAHQRGRSSSPVLMRPRHQQPPGGRMGSQREEMSGATSSSSTSTATTRQSGTGPQSLYQGDNKWSGSTSSKGSSLTDRGSGVHAERRSISTDRGSSVSTEKSAASKSSMKTDRSDRSTGQQERVNRYDSSHTKDRQVVNSGHQKQVESARNEGIVTVDSRRTRTLPAEAVDGRLPVDTRGGVHRDGGGGGGQSLSLGRGGEVRGVREPVEPEMIVRKAGPQSSRENRNNANNVITKEGHHSSSTSLQSLATYTSMTTQMGSASNSPPGTLTNRPNKRQNGRPTRLTHVEEVDPNEPLSDSSQPHSHLGDSQTGDSPSLQTNGSGMLTPHSSMSFSNVMLPGHQVCHTEVTEVILVSDLRGFGLSLGGNGQGQDTLEEPPFISFIEPRSVAERCGVLQEGDRVLTVNGTVLQGKTLDSATRILNDSGIRVCLLVEFDVAESIIPSSGIFNVKVAKKGAGLGITIAAPRDRQPSEPLVISDVKRGSVAHRTGTIHPGDKLLAINMFRLESCSIEDAAHILQQTEEIVKLRLQKEENSPEEPVNMVTYTVELQRRGGPLGVTISGTEEPLDPIFISGLTDGGLAERTGALHIGDRILAINQQSLRGKSLTDAISLLQAAGDTVTLKVTRPLNPRRLERDKNRTSGKSHDSVDSALESWDSSGLDSNGKGKPRPDGLVRESSGSSTGTSNTSSHEAVPTNTLPPPPPAQPSNLKAPLYHQHNTNSRPKSATSYNDLSQQLAYSQVPAQSHDLLSPGSSSPGDSVASSAEQDQWSRQLDELDHLGPLTHHSNQDHFSGFHHPKGGQQHHSVQLQPSHTNTSNNNRNVTTQHFNQTDFHDLEDTTDMLQNTGQHEPTIDFTHADLNKHLQEVGGLPEGAEIELRQVEEQLSKILTPTPIELHRVTLRKEDEPDYGFSLSDGVYEKGVYLSALRPGGPADMSGVIKTYDRILQINCEKVGEMECHEVVPLIAAAGPELTLVISRNPLADPQLVIDDDDASSIWESASMILDSKMV